MPFSNDPYHSKAYKHLEDLEAMYEDLCNMSGILPFIDNVFLPSGDVDIEKSILIKKIKSKNIKIQTIDEKKLEDFKSVTNVFHESYFQTYPHMKQYIKTE